MVSKNSFDNLSELKKSETYISFSASTNTAMQDLLEFRFDDIKYTDISTSYEVESGEEHAISGDKVTITHEIWNGNQATAPINDKLNLKNMKIDNEGNNLAISNIKTGTNLNNLTSVSVGTKFDSNNSLDVIYPANQGKYYVQYDVSIPELEKYGKLSKLNCEVLLGQKDGKKPLEI